MILGGTNRNWASYGHKIQELEPFQKAVLCDPQTSGGLLVAVDESSVAEFQEAMKAEGFDLKPFGEMVIQKEKLVYVKA
ncbi:MAG: hypothetical protein R2784_11015 [Saprospiraceae bacterium]